MLFEACEIAAFTPDKRIIYDSKLMTELDIQAQKDYAVKEALAEGEARKGLEIARNLLAMGLSAEQIVRATGLSSAEVSALR
jgi:predicted transposase/invertase (TIGR01784 family)